MSRTASRRARPRMSISVCSGCGRSRAASGSCSRGRATSSADTLVYLPSVMAGFAVLGHDDGRVITRFSLDRADFAEGLLEQARFAPGLEGQLQLDPAG